MKDMTKLLDQLSLVLFSRHLISSHTIIQITFGWLPEEDQAYLGVTRSMPYGCRIELRPAETCTLAAEAFPIPFNGPMQSRLATLIHEFCHSLLHVKICRWCCGEVKHGAVWQKLARQTERISTQILGMRIDLTRCSSLLRDEDDSQIYSTEHWDWTDFNPDNTVDGRVALKQPELLADAMVYRCYASRYCSMYLPAGPITPNSYRRHTSYCNRFIPHAHYLPLHQKPRKRDPVTTATDGQKDTSTPKPRVQKKPAITLKEVGRYTTDTDSEEEKDSARAQRFTAQGSDKRKTDPENALAECQCTTQTAPRGAALEMNSHTHHPTIGPCNTLSSNNRRAGFPRCPFNHFETRVFFLCGSV
jgi:hypothetical protein